MGFVGSTWFTTLAALRAAEPDWQAIAAYREPIARFLARAYPGLPVDLREDVVQDVLCALRTSAVARFRPERGRFRDYLRGVIRNQVRAAVRARRRELPGLDPDALPAATSEDADAIDLGARLVLAVRAAHDALLAGGAAEREVLYCLSGRLVNGLGYEAIAAREGLSRDAVKRRLARARAVILEALLAEALREEGVELPPRALARLAREFATALSSRRPVEELLARAGPAPAVRVAADLAERVRAGRRWFPGLDSPDGRAFVSALRAVLEPAPEEGP